MAPTPAKLKRIVRGTATSDGAGVSLMRLIGGAELPDLDPFLLLDQFGTDRAADYIGGFPSHPHRGFETVTYMIDGRMRHRDNRGHEGLLGPGSVQWMTAGRGIVHSEMPEQQEGLMRGFQLWVNLAAKDKMTAPRYQDIAPDRIPEVALKDASVRVIAGDFADAQGPVQDVATEPVYLDLRLQPGASVDVPLPAGHNAFVYVYAGHARVGAGASQDLVRSDLGLLGAGSGVRIEATDAPARLILVAGRPLNEPVAKYGPFVMNTQQQIAQALEDFRDGRL